MLRALASVVPALLVCALVAPAAAEPRARLVLVDPDPELERALAAQLGPRAIDVVVDQDALHDDRAAGDRATKWHARYVVWRDDDQLIVFDHENEVIDRRATQMGALGSAAATATARTTVALLHLPGRDLPSGLQLRAEIGGAARVQLGGAGAVGPRFVGDLMIRPSRALGLRVGISDEFGAATAVTRGTFVGNASDLAAGALASWTVELGDRVALEPFVLAGVVHATLGGFDGDVPKSAKAWLPTVAGGSWLRVRFNALVLALGADLRSVPTAPTSTTGVEVVVPRLSVEIGLTAGLELGR